MRLHVLPRRCCNGYLRAAVHDDYNQYQLHYGIKEHLYAICLWCANLKILIATCETLKRIALSSAPTPPAPLANDIATTIRATYTMKTRCMVGSSTALLTLNDSVMSGYEFSILRPDAECYSAPTFGKMRRDRLCTFPCDPETEQCRPTHVAFTQLLMKHTAR